MPNLYEIEQAIYACIDMETGEVIESEVFLGDVSYMTEEATFVFNSIERVVVSQIVKSPSVYYSKTVDKTGREIFASVLNPKRGSWLEIEQKEIETFDKYYNVSLREMVLIKDKIRKQLYSFKNIIIYHYYIINFFHLSTFFLRVFVFYD